MYTTLDYNSLPITIQDLREINTTTTDGVTYYLSKLLLTECHHYRHQYYSFTPPPVTDFDYFILYALLKRLLSGNHIPIASPYGDYFGYIDFAEDYALQCIPNYVIELDLGAWHVEKAIKRFNTLDNLYNRDKDCDGYIIINRVAPYIRSMD